MLLAAWLFNLAAPRLSDLEFAPDNAREGGGRALAQVLAREGVTIRFTRSIEEAQRWATEGTTLLIAYDPSPAAKLYRDLLETDADVVVTSPLDNLIDAVAWKARMSLGLANAPSQPEPVEAQCELPAALAAGTFTSWGTGLDLYDDNGMDIPEGVSGCFPAAWGYHLVHIQNEGRTISVLDDSLAWSNHRITEQGNAALALHLLGQNTELIWLIPQDVPSVSPDSGPALPLRFQLAAAIAALTAVFLAGWQIRRMGPLISERLPVLVKASETTRGRAKLYRANKSYGRAAAALRAGTAQRLGARLGLSDSSGRQALVMAISQATQRDQNEVFDLFYGPAPHNDFDLVHLAQRLDDLEREMNA